MLACGVITLVLFIIVAVYVNKMKKLPPEAFTQQQMGYAGAQPYANQGAYQAPQPGYYQQPYVQPGQNPYAQGAPQQPYGQPYEQPCAQGAPQPPFAQQQDAQSRPLNEQQPPQDPTQNNQ